MMAKKTDSTLLIVGALAVVGYFAFRSGGFLNKTPVAVNPLTGAALPAPQPGSAPQLSSPAGIALELPSPADIGVYAPALDPTGNSLQLF